MTLPDKYATIYLPVRSFLASSRAFSDGQRAVALLSRELNSDRLVLSDWKIHWVAACALLRASIELFKLDKKLCFPALASGVKQEWEVIDKDRADHAIYWGFLRDERNNILHEYKWSAYVQYLDRESKATQPRPGLLSLLPDQYETDLVIRDGPYKGSKAIDIIIKSPEWVEARILSAIKRADLDPVEERNAVTFEKRPPSPPSSLGSLYRQSETE